MKLNELIIRILDAPVKKLEAFRDWLDAGHRATYATKSVTNPLGNRCYVSSEKHLTGYRLIVGFESAADCDAALDFVLAQTRAKAAPEAKP